MKTHVHKALFAGFAALLLAGTAHAQTISASPSSVTMYPNKTASVTLSIGSGWAANANVKYTITGKPSSLTGETKIEPESGWRDAARILTLVSGDVASSADNIMVVATNTIAGGPAISKSISVTVRALPVITGLTLSGAHDGHFHSDTGEAGYVVVSTNTSVTSLAAVSGDTGLYTATVTPENTIAITPKPGASGSANLTVTGKDDLLGGTTTKTIAIAVRPALRITSLTPNPHTFAEDTTGSATLKIESCLDCAFSASHVPDYIIKNASFSPGNGAGRIQNITFTPYTNAYGAVTSTVQVVAGGNVKTVTTNLVINVTPVPDPPEFTGLPDEIIISSKDDWTNAFATVRIHDPDDFPPTAPLKEIEKLTITNVNDGIVFPYPSHPFEIAATNISDKTTDVLSTAISNLVLKAKSGLYGMINTTNEYTVTLTAEGVTDSLSCNTSVVVKVWFKNTPPTFDITSEASVSEGLAASPFSLSSLVDEDIGQSFTLTARVAPDSEQYGLFKVDGVMTNCVTFGPAMQNGLNASLANLEFSAYDGVMTNASETLSFIFEMNDGYDSTTNSPTKVTLVQLSRRPIIYLGGGETAFAALSSDQTPQRLYPEISVIELDEGGRQPVKADITLSAPYIIIDANGANYADLASPAEITEALRNVTFVPNSAALIDVLEGDYVIVSVTVTVTDETGMTVSRPDVTVQITKVNAAPEITVPADQPVLFSPADVCYPFADVRVSNDDTNLVTFTFAMDDAAKGSFSNVVGEGVSVYGPSGYQIVASVTNIVGILTNVVFIRSETYPFPVDDPGGTVFTLKAQDFRFFTTEKTLAIQIQEPPRNWLVTNPLDDGEPGSLSHALGNFENNDVITFALPEYPAVVRLANGPEVTVDKVLTIKGPGADLLTISGDTNGDGVPDRRFLAVGAPLTLEGVTVADCTSGASGGDYSGENGGAFVVVANGHLMLRNVTVRNCRADEYGGAIDVDYGRLTVESSMFLDNVTSVEMGGGGGAVCLYTDQEISFVNTVFARNLQQGLAGYGGGAIYAEFPGERYGFLDVSVVNCTFCDNEDASDVDMQATSIIGSACAFDLSNNIFADDPNTRTINTYAAAEIWSWGGNVCDDESTVFLNQTGTLPKILLNHVTDRLVFDSALDADFVPGNPALTAVASEVNVDLAGRIREKMSLPGAMDTNGAAFPVITEFQFSGTNGTYDCFIEVYAPRGGGTVDLDGMQLLVDGVAVHTFGEGVIANPTNNTTYAAGALASTIPASYRLAPGAGVIVVFPWATNGVAEFQGTSFTSNNPTPVVRASIATDTAEFVSRLSKYGRGTVSIVSSLDTANTITHHTFLTVFNDPESVDGQDLLDTANQSIVSVPHGKGFAFLPHRYVNNTLKESPGADEEDNPFGEDNAPPQAHDDAASGTEDDITVIDALANDTDADGDPLMVVAFNATSVRGATVMYDAAEQLFYYDPTTVDAMQAFPAGRSDIDTFTYTILDGIAIQLDGTVGVATNLPNYTVTCTTGYDHGLVTNDFVWIDNIKFTVTNTTPRSFFFNTTNAVVVSGISTKTAYTRNPANASTATVTVSFTGLNDNPIGVADLLVATLSEREAVRLLAQTNFSYSTSTMFNEYPQHPVLGCGLLSNDTDIDDDAVNADFRITGVLSAADVHPVALAPSADGTATVVTSSGHGLATGATVVIVGVANPARVNGAHAATVIDANTFSIAIAPGSALSGTGWWIPSTSATSATTPLGAAVSFVPRADELRPYDSVVYNASVSAPLQALALTESAVDGFWYVFVDNHNAPGIAPVTLTVIGSNNPPITADDPPCINDLPAEWGDDLADILTNRLAALTVLVPPESGVDGRADVIVADKNTEAPTSADLILLADFYSTDEETPLLIYASDLLANDTDIDTNDLASACHYISLNSSTSLRGAAITLDPSTNVVYNPQGSAELQALAINETVFDIFTVHVSDGKSTTPSRVAVLVRGVNDKPVAWPVWVTNETAAAEVTFDPNVTDVDINDIFPPLTVTVPDPALATNYIPYTVTDHSLFLAVDDTFRVAAGAKNIALDVLANDVNFHNTGSRVIAVTPSLAGGTVAPSATGDALVYSPPGEFAGTDIFTYTVTNAIGVVRKANVRVRVIAHDYNGPLHACDDEYALARGMSFTMDVTANDALIPFSPAGILVDPVYNTDWPAGLSLANNVFTYDSAGLDPGAATVVFHYRALGGGDASSIARVLVKIIDRSLGNQPDYFTAAPGAAPVAFDVLANDVILGDSTEGMRITGVETNVPAGFKTAGTVAIAADGRTVTYAAPAGFIGVDVFRYAAQDRYGATGTTNVYVTVGVPAATPDSMTVATNTVTLIDVLANDTTLPYAPPASFILQSVTLASGAANGIAAIVDNKVRFAAGFGVNAAAVWNYTAAVPNSPVVVTGELSVVTSRPGELYANADNYTVRANSSTVPLDVLANDISYRPGAFPLSFGQTPSISAKGGSVSRVNAILYYTPPAGYVGVDTFSYTVNDGRGLPEEALVTIRVVTGDLIANHDAFIVGYEWDGSVGAAKGYTLPVLGNDSVFPGGGTLALTANFGSGTGALEYESTLELSPDGTAVVFRPGKSPSNQLGVKEYTETFIYEVTDGTRIRSASVEVTVRDRVRDIEMETQNDVFVVERDSTENVLHVTANDLVEPKTPLSPIGIHVTASVNLGTISVDGDKLVYTPPPGFVGIDTATYTITDGLGGTGSANVTIYVGSLPTADDSFAVLFGTTTLFDVVANDAVNIGYLDSYRPALTAVFGATEGGTAVIDGSRVSYTPDPNYRGAAHYPYTEVFFYELKDDSERLTTGTVSVVVYDLSSSQASSLAYVINPSGTGFNADGLRELWNRGNFNDWQVANGEADGNADPDGDGLSNDAEYVFGGDPNDPNDDPDIGHIFISLLADGAVEIYYIRRVSDPSVTFSLEGRASLTAGDWTKLDTLSSVSFSDYAANDELKIAIHHIPANATDCRFFRIAVTF